MVNAVPTKAAAPAPGLPGVNHDPGKVCRAISMKSPGWAGDSMAISDLPIFSMLRTRMHWHQERQRLLSENVANSDTPNFRARDLAPLTLDNASRPPPALALLRTDAHHQAGGEGGRSGFPVDRK